jgi:hypothetical protein
LIVVEIVGETMLLMLLWFVAALIFRLRFQFSIRSLLVLAVVVSIACSWFATEKQRAREQKQAVAEIRKAGGGSVYDYEFDRSGYRMPPVTPPGPPWLCKLLGDDLFGNVWSVSFNHFVGSSKPEVSDAGLEHLKGLSQLRWLKLNHTHVSDAGLEHLEGLPHLEQLDLSGTKVTDAGLQHLEGLPRLREVWLDDTQITDAGLKHLKRLAQLQKLRLDNTKVTDAGLEHLQGLPKLYGFPQLQELSLIGTQVTDAGLEHVRELNQLQKLWLAKTKVTAEGVKKLRQALLRDCVIDTTTTEPP